MENITSRQEVPTGGTERVVGDHSGFGSFLIDLKSLLRNKHVKSLVTAFDFKPSEREEVESNEDPGLAFVHSLTEKGIIRPANISALLEKLHFCGLHGIADDVNASFKRYYYKTKTQSSKSQEYEDKKMKFTKQLSNKYKNLCAGIRPVPFLREKYNIDKLFVESGIKFLEENQRGVNQQRENWTKLSSYKKIFTDSRVESKKHIVDGEPGIGKSTLALQIAHDWCLETSPMDDIEILILLRMRQIKKILSIYTAIKQLLLPKNSKLTEDDIENILERSITLVLLDGYDEYPNRESRETDFDDIIKGEMLPDCHVILMTRTFCLPKDYSYATKRIRMTGFDAAAREKYIQNVVANGDAEKADGINQFLSENTVIADLCMVPLFLVMVSHMNQENVLFQNLRSSTEIFRYVVACFYSHTQIKETDTKVSNNGKLTNDHRKLDKVAFEGLSGDVQQISWNRDEILGKIGDNLYDECVRVGILIEEDVFDAYTIEYKTDVRFHHKLFHEWYAAHHLAKEAARSDARFETWSELETEPESEDTESSDKLSHGEKNTQVLKNLDLDDLHNVYQFACGLNTDAALKIIKHLATLYTRHTLLCINEWGGSLGEISNTITTLCSRNIEIRNCDSLLLQKTTIELLTFAASKTITISQLCLRDSLDQGAQSTGNLLLKSNLCLPAMNTLRKVVIWEEGLEIKQEGTASILQYSTKCLELEKLEFYHCLLPRYTTAAEPLSLLKVRNVTVSWLPPNVGFFYSLNLESGRWEKHNGSHDKTTCSPMTDEEYQQVVMEVRRWAKMCLEQEAIISEDSS